MIIGRIKYLTLREVFKTESAKNGFNDWLYNNIDYLSEATDLDLSNPSREEKQHTMRVDILADLSGREKTKVVIEAQFGQSNHDHLGKLLSYVAYQDDATYCIWICENARIEHIKALEMLNRSNGLCKYFLIEASALKIGDSDVAIQFNNVVEPVTCIEEDTLSESEQKRLAFWSDFIEHCKKRNVATLSGISPKTQHWIDGRIGKGSAHFAITANRNSMSIQFIFDASEEKKNKEAFERFRQHREEIEKMIDITRPDESLNWRAMEGCKTCMISQVFEGNRGWMAEGEDKDMLIEGIINKFLALEKALKPFYCLL